LRWQEFWALDDHDEGILAKSLIVELIHPVEPASLQG
jgi:hypothetical protein